MSIYLRAVSFMAGRIAAPRHVRLTSMFCYLPYCKGLMVSYEPPQLFNASADQERAKFEAEVSGMTWGVHHAYSSARCATMAARYAVLTAQQAAKARTLLAVSRDANDAMTALELRTQALDAIAVGHRYRGRAALLAREIIDHIPLPPAKRAYVKRKIVEQPAQDGLPRVKRAYTRRVAA